MKIDIKDFCNIRSLTLELEENKFNFIYGISGSGKTSIGKALSCNVDSFEDFTTFGQDTNANITTNIDSSFQIFNENTVEEYIFTRSGTGIYDVIYGRNQELDKLKTELSNVLNNNTIISIRSIVDIFQSNLKKLEQGIEITPTNTGVSETKGLMKLLKEQKPYYNKKSKKNSEIKTWIKSGYHYINENECPFCEQDMSEVIVKNILTVINELPEIHEKVIRSKGLLSEVGIIVDVSTINSPDTQNLLKDEVKKIYKLNKILNNIVSTFNISINNDKSLAGMKKLKFDKITVDFFNIAGIDIKLEMDNLFSAANGYIEKKTRYNKMFQSHIKSNMRIINEDIERFGIKYKFIKDDTLDKTAKYKLIHINSDNDNSSSLSTGEKNIVSLVLFVVSMINQNIIIDDPASSFDEYRREQILEYIFKSRYKGKSKNKTTLVLSHDQIFLKFLCRNYMSDSNLNEKIGNVSFLFNDSNSSIVTKITEMDINLLSEHIRKKLQTANNYKHKILLLRMFYEVVDRYSKEYSYISGILHSFYNPMDEVTFNKNLIKNDIEEDSILKSIKRQTDIELPLYFNRDEIVLDKDALSDFEKLCFIREMKIIENEDKKELNNIMHFNYAMNHILNPFKFNFQSIKSYEILSKYGYAIK